MPMERVNDVDLIDVLKELTSANHELRSEIRQLREDFNPEIRSLRIIELREEQERKESEAIARADLKFQQRQEKKRKGAQVTHSRLDVERTAERTAT